MVSRLDKLRYSKSISKHWKTMFELYDWLKFTNDNGMDCCADYFYFMRICQDEMLRIGITTNEIPALTTKMNWICRYFELERKFDSLDKVKQLADVDEYNIFYLNGKVRIRVKNYDTSNIRRNSKS